jgi:hypothetical protein
MAGIIKLPIAAVVAGPDPLSEENIMQANMVTMARPPVMLPTILRATSIIPSVIPAGSIK